MEAITKKNTRTKKNTKNINEDIELTALVKKGKDSDDTVQRRRSEEAFSTLFGKYKNPLLFKFKISNNENDADAEDFLMRAFEKAYKSIDSYNPQYAFSTWIYKIATNLYIDHLRKNTADVVNIESCSSDDGEGNTIEFEIADKNKNPEETLEADERAILVREAVGNIKNEIVRKMVILFFFEQKSYKEIAAITSTPIGTVKGNLSRAKGELTKTLASLNRKLETA